MLTVILKNKQRLLQISNYKRKPSVPMLKTALRSKSTLHQWTDVKNSIGSIERTNWPMTTAVMDLQTTGLREADVPENERKNVVLSSDLEAEFGCLEIFADFAVTNDIGKRTAQNT